MGIRALQAGYNSAQDEIQRGLDAITPSRDEADDATSFFSDLPSIFETSEPASTSPLPTTEEQWHRSLIAQKSDTDNRIFAIVKMAWATNVDKARKMLCQELLKEDYCSDRVKEKALDLLYELLNEKSFEEQAASGLVGVAKALMQLASGDFFQDNHVRIQAKIVLNFGLAMRVNHYHFTKKRKGGIQQKDKKNFIQMGKTIQNLSGKGDPKLEFSVDFALETHKRVKDDSKVLLEIFKRVTSVLAGLSAGYNRQLGAMVIHFKNALHDIDHHITSKWYDHYLLLDEHARGARENMTKFLAFLIESKTSMEKCKDWKLVMAYLWLLKELIIHSNNQEIRGRALLGWEVIEDPKGKGNASAESAPKIFLMGLVNFLSFDDLGKDSYKIRHECAEHLVYLLEKETKSKVSKNEKFIAAITKHLVNRIKEESDPEIHTILRKPELVQTELRRTRKDESAKQAERHKVIKGLLSENDPEKGSPNVHKRSALPTEMRARDNPAINVLEAPASTSLELPRTTPDDSVSNRSATSSATSIELLQHETRLTDKPRATRDLLLHEFFESLLLRSRQTTSNTISRATVLHSATYQDLHDLSKALTENIQDIDVEDASGKTALETALSDNTTMKSMAKIASILFAKAMVGSKVMRPKSLHILPLKDLSYRPKEFQEITIFTLHLLLMFNPDYINIPNELGKLPIHIATTDEVIKLLLNRGAKIDSVDKDGYTPLYYAIKDEDYEYISCILANGANVNFQFDDGSTPLHSLLMAISKSFKLKQKILNLLLSYNAEINAVNKEGRTPLFYLGSPISAYHQNEEDIDNFVRFMVQRTASVNAEDKDRCTPLHAAIITTDYKVAKALVKNQSNVNALTCHNHTPLDLVELFKIDEKEEERKKFKELLLEHGAKTGIEVLQTLQ